MALTTSAATVSQQQQHHGGGGGSSISGPHHHQKDTTFTKIFVGGLPYHTTDQTLRNFFEPFGDIVEAVVITDRQTGKSRGYGFVTMMDEAAAQRACKDPNPIIDGRKANVNLAYLGAKPRLPVGDLLAAASFPYGLKTASTSGLTAVYPVGEIFGLPQLIYQSPATAAAFLQPAAGGVCNPASAAALTVAATAHLPQQPAPHSALSAAALAAAVGHPATTFIDYQTAAALAAAGYPTAHLAPTGFDATGAYPAVTAAAGPPGQLGHTAFLTATNPATAAAAAAAAAAAGFTLPTFAAVGGSPGASGPGPTAAAAALQSVGHHQFAHFRPLQIQERM